MWHVTFWSSKREADNNWMWIFLGCHWPLGSLVTLGSSSQHSDVFLGQDTHLLTNGDERRKCWLRAEAYWSRNRASLPQGSFHSWLPTPLCAQQLSCNVVVVRTTLETRPTSQLLLHRAHPLKFHVQSVSSTNKKDTDVCRCSSSSSKLSTS